MSGSVVRVRATSGQGLAEIGPDRWLAIARDFRAEPLRPRRLDHGDGDGVADRARYGLLRWWRQALRLGAPPGRAHERAARFLSNATEV
jgi:hypothetical protein